VVYKAEDTRLLPTHLAQDAAALECFQREARAASALNHPNICTVHEIDEYEARPFIAMELLQGETLADRISGKPLPTDLVLKLSIQITEALEAAHQRELSIAISSRRTFSSLRDQVKVLDFGLAKLASRVIGELGGGATSMELGPS
jgi:non-specific serine/threonine protein kinase